MKRNMTHFSPQYDGPIRCALIFQVIGAVIALTMIPDMGLFALYFLCSSLVFWVLAGVLIIKRPRPSWVERAIIAGGPLLVFLAMFFVG